MGVQVEKDPQRGSVVAATRAEALQHLERRPEVIGHIQVGIKGQQQVLKVEVVVRVGFFTGGSPCVVVQLLEAETTKDLQVDARVVSGVVDGHGWVRVAKLGPGYIAAQVDCHPK